MSKGAGRVVVDVDIALRFFQLIQHGFHVEEILFAGDTAVPHGDKGCSGEVKMVACRRDAKKRTGMCSLEIPMLDNLVPLAEGIDDGEFDV